MNPPRVALIHDWLVAHRGGEQVLLELCKLFPEAPIYTLVYDQTRVHPEIARRQIHTSFIQQLPGAPQRFRRYLPLFPAAAEALDLRDYDLLVSTSHCVAKGVRLAKGQRHISYVHTPMRYIWDQLPQYARRLPFWARPLARPMAAPLRLWDVRTASRPTTLVANSRFVAQRIARVWGRPDAHVVYPPVDVSYFAAAKPKKRQGFVVVSALVPYKRVDLAVQWATRHGEPLIVVGDGECAAALRKQAGPTIEFRSGLRRQDLRRLYAGAEGLLFCGVEDFGIVPVEAMAAGCPVVALGAGGALETVRGADAAQPTGVFFPEPSVSHLHAAVMTLRQLWRAGHFKNSAMLEHCQQFRPKVFAAQISELLRQPSSQQLQSA